MVWYVKILRLSEKPTKLCACSNAPNLRLKGYEDSVIIVRKAFMCFSASAGFRVCRRPKRGKIKR